MTRVHLDDAFAGLNLDFTVKLWRDNRLDGEYDIKATDLLAGFRSFAEGYDGDKREYYGSERMLLEYITTKGGLCSAVAWPWRNSQAREHDDGPDSLTSGQWDELCHVAHIIVWGRG